MLETKKLVESIQNSLKEEDLDTELNRLKDVSDDGFDEKEKAETLKYIYEDYLSKNEGDNFWLELVRNCSIKAEETYIWYKEVFGEE